MGAEGVKMATQIEVDGGPLLREQAQASPPPPLWLATAAEKTAHKQISDAHRATELEEVAVRSMAEHRRNGAGGSRATVAESGNIVSVHLSNVYLECFGCRTSFRFYKYHLKYRLRCLVYLDAAPH